MADITIALDKTLKHEGGYVNDPLDRGGETICGIARKFWGSWSGWKILDEKTKNTTGALKTKTANLLLKDSLFMKEVREFYKKNFWDEMNLDKITDQRIAENMFDFAVNSGVKKAAQKIQQILKLTADGEIGPKSIAAINSTNPEWLLKEYKESRRQFFLAIVENNPSQARFINGWMKRVEEA